MDAKERALDIAGKLAAVEANGSSPELTALHASLWAGVYEQADALGFDEDDLAEIGEAASGTAQRGGGPKPPPPQE